MTAVVSKSINAARQLGTCKKSTYISQFSCQPRSTNAGVGSLKTIRTFATSHTGAQAAQPTKHTLPDLPYPYNALEPAIPEEIMLLHHQKHHNTYITNLNTAEQSMANALTSGDVVKQIALQSAIKFNGGGDQNHRLFWKNLAPTGSDQTKIKSGSKLESAIKDEYGSVEEFKAKLGAAALAIQGSGWAWLGKSKDTGRLIIETTKDQDPLLSATPIIGIDMWEHAYYIKYKNVKAEYLKAIWTVINWEEAESRFAQI